MKNYRLQTISNNITSILFDDGSGRTWSVPIIDPTNTDFINVKNELAEGASLKDATGTAMTAEQIKTFLETLP